MVRTSVMNCIVKRGNTFVSVNDLIDYLHDEAREYIDVGNLKAAEAILALARLIREDL